MPFTNHNYREITLSEDDVEIEVLCSGTINPNKKQKIEDTDEDVEIEVLYSGTIKPNKEQKIEDTDEDVEIEVLYSGTINPNKRQKIEDTDEDVEIEVLYSGTIKPNKEQKPDDKALQILSVAQLINQLISKNHSLTEIEKTLLLKFIKRSQKYHLDASVISDRKNHEQFHDGILAILNIPTEELITNQPTPTISVKAKDIYTIKNEFIKKINLLHPDEKLVRWLFSNIFAIKLLQTIREYNISISDCFYTTEEHRKLDTEKLFNYQPNIGKSGCLISPEGEPLFWDNYKLFGQKQSEQYILQERLNTPKGKVPSITALWDNDSRLHTYLYKAVNDQLGPNSKGRTRDFDRIQLKRAICRNDTPCSFRAKTIADVSHYLHQNGLIKNTDNSFFDSSIGWLDRLTGALLSNKGTRFKRYVGTDPNPVIPEKAKELLEALSEYNPEFFGHFFDKPVEDLDEKQIIKKNNNHYFDMALTSPPFGLKSNEKYAISSQNDTVIQQQAWKRYTTEREFTGFLSALIYKNISILTAGGIFVLHFKEDALVEAALTTVRKAHPELNINLLTKGKYYSSFRKKETPGLPKPYESMFFFQRSNKIEKVPSLIKDNKETKSNKDSIKVT